MNISAEDEDRIARSMLDESTPSDSAKQWSRTNVAFVLMHRRECQTMANRLADFIVLCSRRNSRLTAALAVLSIFTSASLFSDVVFQLQTVTGSADPAWRYVFVSVVALVWLLNVVMAVLSVYQRVVEWDKKVATAVWCQGKYLQLVALIDGQLTARPAARVSIDFLLRELRRQRTELIHPLSDINMGDFIGVPRVSKDNGQSLCHWTAPAVPTPTPSRSREATPADGDDSSDRESSDVLSDVA